MAYGYIDLPCRSMPCMAWINVTTVRIKLQKDVVFKRIIFLEKIFLLHEEFTRPGGCSRIERLTRHMYDIVKMMDKPFATDAMNNYVMYNEIVAHRKAFTAWSGLDYTTHHPRTISFVPPTETESALRNDYEQMKYGFIYKDAPEYDRLIERLTELQLKFRNLEWAK